MEHELRQQIRAAVLAADGEKGRARVLVDLVLAVYDTVKSVHAGGGLDDTAERTGIAAVSNTAHDHLSEMEKLDHRGGEAMIVQRLEDITARDPHEEFQQKVTAPQPADDHQIRLSVYEAEKCGAIIAALVDGHTLWADAARKVSFLLSVRSIEATGITVRARDPWPDLAELPWPPPPGLRADPHAD